MAASERSWTSGTVGRLEIDTLVIELADKQDGNQLTADQKDIATTAKSFLEYQYPEIKDLAKQFLTVIAGVLTLSVAFSDKIAPFNMGPQSIKLLMVGIWACCFLAFVAGGAGIFLIYNAGVIAKYAAVSGIERKAAWPYPRTYHRMRWWSQTVLALGGLAFVVALGLFACIGYLKLFGSP